jgi:phosphoribosylformimino-5-aminoimidazole carboxamide ribotide isomerase
LCAGSEPLVVAHAFRELLGLTEFYVADLDAISGGRGAPEIWRALVAEGFSIWLDAGLRSVEQALAVAEAGARRVIAGLETWPGPSELERACNLLGADRLVFSLDLKEGKLLATSQHWMAADPLEIALSVVSARVRQLIVLDLAGVGTLGGVVTLALCREIRKRCAGLSLYTGGGVRGPADLQSLVREGLSGVLVASALHDGRLTRADVEIALQ